MEERKTGSASNSVEAQSHGAAGRIPLRKLWEYVNTKDEPSNYHPVHLEIYFHLESENADEHCLKNIGEMRLVTDEFVCGYNGTGPGNLLEVLRAAGITEKMFPDEEIVEKREKPLNVHFSARETIYTGALKEVYDP